MADHLDVGVEAALGEAIVEVHKEAGDPEQQKQGPEQQEGPELPQKEAERDPEQHGQALEQHAPEQHTVEQHEPEQPKQVSDPQHTALEQQGAEPEQHTPEQEDP